LVADEVSRAVAFVAITGDAAKPETVQNLPAYSRSLLSVDIERQNRIRTRVTQYVEDPSIVKKLQPWYPTWCRRPCFHNDYLPTFNRKNVTLVDTDGRDIDQMTANSIVVDDDSYAVDIVIFATGFRPRNIGSFAERTNMTIFGLNGLSMEDEWARSGPATIHGVLDHQFPNLFFLGPFQAIASPVNTFSLDVLAQHVAYIITEGARRAGGKSFAVAPTAAAAEDWATQVTARGMSLAVGGVCTSDFTDLEDVKNGEMAPGMALSARWRGWGHGVEDYVARVEAWRSEGNMQGIEVRT
jgi:cation diffusion facilitator CzcD-associated flavoprotein CzcO